jgi:hypothetical protein
MKTDQTEKMINGVVPVALADRLVGLEEAKVSKLVLQ